MRVDNLWNKMENIPTVLLATIFCAALVSFFFAIFNSKLESALILWMLGVSVVLPYCNVQTFLTSQRSYESRILGFVFIFASCLASKFGFIQIGLFLAFVAAISYFGNKKIVLSTFMAIAIWFFLVPNAEYIHYFVSYPLRVIAANASGEILYALSFDTSVNSTLVSINGKEIAVTAACSGIEQLEAMVLVGWIIAVKMNKSLLMRLAHLATIVPIVIIFNTFRLCGTLVGDSLFGDIFLSNTIHTLLGIIMVLCVVVAFIGMGKLFQSYKGDTNLKEKIQS